MKTIFYGNLELKTKTRALNCYVSSIFLYNSELWTLTSTLEAAIDSFHRKLIRISCLNVKWPQIVTNEELYKTTNITLWSKTVRKRQLSWFGHMIRLASDCPAKISQKYVLEPTAKPKGRPQTTWLSMMIKRLKELICFSHIA